MHAAADHQYVVLFWVLSQHTGGLATPSATDRRGRRVRGGDSERDVSMALSTFMLWLTGSAWTSVLTMRLGLTAIHTVYPIRDTYTHMKSCKCIQVCIIHTLLCAHLLLTLSRWALRNIFSAQCQTLLCHAKNNLFVCCSAPWLTSHKYIVLSFCLVFMMCACQGVCFCMRVHVSL